MPIRLCLRAKLVLFIINCLVGKGYNFDRIIYKLRYHFKTEENKQQYILEWRETTFLKIIIINLGIL